MIKERNLDSSLKSLIGNSGIIGSAERHYICPSGYAPYTYWGDRAAGDRFHSTISGAHSKMTTGRNDVAILSPDSHSQAAALTWSNNMSHLIGAYGPARQNQRPRIGHSANFTPILTVSGYGNTFANLYFMHGRGNAANLVCLSLTGPRNTFIRSHFLPANATELDQAAYRLISIDDSEQNFIECTFGSDTVAWTNGAMIQLGATGDGGPPRTVFEDCIFYMYADNAQVRFLDASLAGLGRGLAIFLNCHFINVGTSLAYAINGAGLSAFQLYFDNRCSFAGVTEIVEAAYENYVWCGCANLGGADWVTGGAAVKLGNLIASHPDVS